jgi:DNA repair exonuclease SbcCD ATPase subunit
MNIVDLIEKIITVLVTLTTGGFIGWIIKARFISDHEKISIATENEEQKAADLKNAESIIALYKNALRDITEQSKKLKAQYEAQISQLTEKINKLEREASEYANQIQLQTKNIDLLTRNQIKMKMDIMSVKTQSLQDCENCAFNSNCEKFKAKKLSYEQTDNSTLLSDGKQ